ncbi:MAG: hypothetical protein WB611_10640 [Stellaceae bacterium]
MTAHILIAATALLPVLTSPAALAAQKCIPIHFARGAWSATVRGIAQSMDTPDSGSCYTLTTAKGETATLTIITTSPDDDTAFTIPGVVDNQQNYSFKTEAKTYTIAVYLTFARQPDRPFTMRVTVK